MENNVATLETVYETRKPRGFGWAFKPVDKMGLDMFWLKLVQMTN